MLINKMWEVLGICHSDAQYVETEYYIALNATLPSQTTTEVTNQSEIT